MEGVWAYLVLVGLGGLLHGLLDVVVGGGLLQPHSEVHNGHIDSGDTDGHASQFANEIR